LNSEAGFKGNQTRRNILKTAIAAAVLPLANAEAISLRAATTPAKQASPAAIKAQRQHWVAVAESLKPHLRETIEAPLSVVHFAADSNVYLRWQQEVEAPGSDLPKRLLRKGDHFILDFGGHRTGHLQFRLVGEGNSVDAPVRLKITFGEVPGDVTEPLYPYHGNISSSWLAEEIITIDFLPQLVRMPHRYAFRYVKVEVMDTSPNFGVRFLETAAIALTSARATAIQLPSGMPDWVRKVDRVCLLTLRDCMQTIFEDAPRRDQRLWIGDFRLQAKACYYTYPNFALVKRCLYLFAGLPRESDGFLSSCVYEKPFPRTGGMYHLDYSALYASTLLDYARASHDLEAARELFPVAQTQIEILFQHVDENGIFHAPPETWVFIDWNKGLDLKAAMQGVLIYSGRRLCELATLIGNPSRTAALSRQLDKMSLAAREHFYDREKGVFTSGSGRQVSWASQAWLTLAGCLSRTEAAETLRRVIVEDKTSVRPNTAYLYHHVLEAMIECGMVQEAMQLIKSYWGGMIEDGADTFWEAYDPKDSTFSPYRDIHVNSFCHGWSATPSYFFRTMNRLT